MSKTRKRKTSIRRTPISRIDHYQFTAKVFLGDEKKLITRINANSKKIGELTGSDDPLAKTNIAVLQFKNKKFSKDLARVTNKRLAYQQKIEKAITLNNSLDSAQ